jgi:hypothetical protein
VASALARGTWPADTTDWEESILQDADWLKRTLRDQCRDLPVRRRMAHDGHEPALCQVLGLWWAPDDVAFARAAIHSPVFAHLAAPRDVHAPASRQRLVALWEATLAHLFLRADTATFDVLRFVHGVLQHEADEQGLDEATLARAVLPHVPPATSGDRPPEVMLKSRLQALAATPASPPAPAPADEAPPRDIIYLSNAGLVLAGAYLERLFRMLGLVDDEAFVTPAAAKRAVHLLQYLVSGEEGVPEPELVLNKVLCGLRPETPLRREFRITPEEANAIDGLLAAMVSHWKILGHTTVAGLRETFLMREGQLSRDDDGWQLRVAERSFDMLLDQLPWGYRLLKFPWMERPLHVDWR